MAPAPLSDSEVVELLAGRPLCTACVLAKDAAAGPGTELWVNALVVDAGDVVHAGDAIAGSTACGLDANRWRWVIPTKHQVVDVEVER